MKLKLNLLLFLFITSTSGLSAEKWRVTITDEVGILDGKRYVNELSGSSFTSIYSFRRGETKGLEQTYLGREDVLVWPSLNGKNITFVLDLESVDCKWFTTIFTKEKIGVNKFKAMQSKHSKELKEGPIYFGYAEKIE